MNDVLPSPSRHRRLRLRRLTSVWNSGWRRKELTTKMRSDQVAGMTNELAPRRGRWGKTEKRPGEQWGLAEGRTPDDAEITVSNR